MNMRRHKEDGTNGIIKKRTISDEEPGVQLTDAGPDQYDKTENWYLGVEDREKAYSIQIRERYAREAKRYCSVWFRL